MSLISLFPSSLTAGSVLNAQWRLQMNVAVINHFICPMKMVFFLFRYCSLLCYGKYSLFPASSRVITFTHTHIWRKTNQQPFFDIIAAWVYVIILYDQVKKKIYIMWNVNRISTVYMEIVCGWNWYEIELFVLQAKFLFPVAKNSNDDLHNERYLIGVNFSLPYFFSDMNASLNNHYFRFQSILDCFSHSMREQQSTSLW